MSQRIAVIDVIRGYCLVNIYINHISAGQLHRFSPSARGLSDSADIFVLLAGVAAFLAYGKLDMRAQARALLARATKLYAWNMLLVVCTLAVLTGLAWIAGADALGQGPKLSALARAPWPAAAWDLLTMRQSIGYSAVLRLYVGLMVMAPVFLWLAARRWWWALPPAVLAWIAAGQLRMVAHDSLTATPMVLNILPWSLIFACGVTLAAGRAQGVRLPRSRLLAGAALALLLGCLILPYVEPHWPAARAWLATRDEHFWLGASKSLMSPLRALHLLALVYLFVAYADAPVIRLVHAVRPSSFLAVLGRRSLPVFVTGAVLAVVGDEILTLAQRDWGFSAPIAIGLELVIVATGIAIQWAIATRPERRPEPAWSSPGLTGTSAASAG